MDPELVEPDYMEECGPIEIWAVDADGTKTKVKEIVTEKSEEKDLERPIDVEP